MAPPASILFNDPTGERYGIPTYPWNQAPPGLATYRQLAAYGLRPGGQEPVAQLLWRSRLAKGATPRVAYLYDIAKALPKRMPTARQCEALEKALKAQRICPRCGEDRGYRIRPTLGVCNACADDWEWRAA